MYKFYAVITVWSDTCTENMHNEGNSISIYKLIDAYTMQVSTVYGTWLDYIISSF